MNQTEQAQKDKRGQRKERTGIVVANSQNKTVTVEFVYRVPHPKYNKVVKQKKRYLAHDEKNEALIGDTVKIVETRPLSKTKRWRLVEVVSHLND